MILDTFKLFVIFLKLGLTSFGGPMAHLGYFRREFVEKLKWLNDHEFSEILALCQLLPGPTSSQVAMLIGKRQLGVKGLIASWIGFTFPSAILMLSAAFIVRTRFDAIPEWMLTGLNLTTAVIVTQTVFVMQKQLCPTFARKLFALALGLFLVFYRNINLHVYVILSCILFGLWKSNFKILKNEAKNRSFDFSTLLTLSIFALLFLATFFEINSNPYLKNFFHFFKSGSLIFGGGHVLLPLLNDFSAQEMMIDPQIFSAGYGFTQIIPGPLFSFCGFLGASQQQIEYPIANGLICLVAVFSPSFLLLPSIDGLWRKLKQHSSIVKIISYTNAGVVGILGAALINPIATHALLGPSQILIFAGGLYLSRRRNFNLAWIVLFCIFFSLLSKVGSVDSYFARFFH